MGIMRPIRKTPDFNPRSPCGERLERAVAASTHISISIHALLAESDPALAQYPLHSSAFQSTLSLRRATEGAINAEIEQFISIHALLAESDHDHRRRSGIRYISIHALLAESDEMTNEQAYELVKFQSTLSLRRATAAVEAALCRTLISIHALLAESDRARRILQVAPGHFNPRSPCGERHNREQRSGALGGNFNPRSPCGERPQ